MLRGIFLLFIIAVISGAIAYLGNRLGRFVGKKKLTIFHLRPMHTSTLFTIITGILISLLTIGVSSIMSENVRIALFGMEKLQKERLALQEEVNRLSAQASQGKIMFTAGQAIVLNLIEGGKSAEIIKSQILQMIDIANARSVKKYNLLADYYKITPVKPETNLVNYNPEEVNNAAKTINKSGGNWGVTISAKNNVYLEGKFDIDIKLLKNILIYSEGEEISAIKIDTSKNKNEILADLFTLIYKTRENANARGMIRDPEQQLSMPPAKDLDDFVKRIQSYSGWVLVKSTAARNLYTVDAPEVKLTPESTQPPES